MLAQHIENRVSQVTGTFRMVRDYRFDVKKEEWCELVIGVPLTLSKIDFSTMLKDICDNSVVYEVPGIRRAIVYKNNRGEVSKMIGHGL